KFQEKVDEVFLVGYSVCSKAFRVFNSRTRIIQETLHVNFLENKPNVTGFQADFDAKKAGEDVDQSYMLFPVWSTGFINPQNNAKDAAFDGKEHDFDVKKPESKVILSPSSNTQSKEQDDKTNKEAKGKSHVESVTRYRDLNAEFEDCSKKYVAGPSTNAVSPTYGKISDIDASQLLDDPDMPGLEDIIYSNDENVVGAEADFNNLESSIPEEGIDYEEVFAPVARIEAIRFCLAYASFMGFMVYQTDVKSAFLYGTIEEEVSFKKVMKDKFQMSSMGELTFFLGLKVKQKKDGIFISQDKYVAEILRKFGLTTKKSASTPIDTEKPLLKDPDGEDVDVHTYRLMIGSLMYLTSSRPDIMFAVCACAHFQVTPKASHIHAVKRIFRYLKGKPHLGLWYPKDSPFDLVAYSDSDYAGAMDSESIAGLWCWLSYLTTNGSQFTMSNPHKNWLVQKQTALGKGKSNPLMADNLPKIVWYSTHHIPLMKSWLVQKQMALSKDKSNSLMADNLPKILWYSTHHIPLMKSWLVQKQTALGQTATGKEISNLFMAGSLPKTILTIFLHNTVVVKQSNDVTRLQALIDKKNVVITEATIKDALRLDDAAGVDCLPNEEIFAELARMGYENPSTKLTFYKAFFSSQYIFESLVRNVDSSSKFYMYPRFIQLIIQNWLGDLSTHTTTYTSPALTQKVFANMRRVGKRFSRVETPLFEGLLVGVIEEQGATKEQVQDDVDDAAAQGDDTAVPGNDVHEPSIPSLTPSTQPQQSQDLPSTSQEALDACDALTRRVEHLEYDKVSQALEITKRKRRVKKLERGNNAKVLKLRRLKKVGTSQRIDSLDDTEMEDASNQRRMIDELDKDEGVALMDDKEKKRKQKRLKLLDEPEVQEVVDVVTTAKLITEVVTAASELVTAAKEPKPLKKKQLVKIDEEYERKLHEELNKDIDWNVVIDHVKQKDKEDPYVKNIRLDYFKGMSYDDIRPIFQAKFNSNIEFLLKSKEQLEEEKNRAIESINETIAQKAAKRRKLNEEVKDLKQHLEIVPDEDNDVYTEATPLARKVPVVDYEIIHFNNKPYYKVIRADGTHQLYVSFITLLKNFDREDLESLWSIVKERFSTSKPNNFSDDFLLTTLGAMFKRPDGQAQFWKNQRTVHGQARVKN
nr:hypothetical protein [Tanacetum cinerariifolium]